jgi:hypothetical protein
MIYIHRGLEWEFKAIFVMLLEIYKRMLFGVGAKVSFQTDAKFLKPEEKQACHRVWGICSHVSPFSLLKRELGKVWLTICKGHHTVYMRLDGMVVV